MFKNTILCLRFPFLYPRNICNNKHCNYIPWADKLLSYLQNKAFSKILLIPEVYSKNDNYKENTREFIFQGQYKVKLAQNIIIIFSYSGERLYEKDLTTIIGDNYIVSGISHTLGYNNVHIIKYHICPKQEEKVNSNFCHISTLIKLNPLYELLYKTFSFIHKNLLERIWIFPAFTELDALPKGWRKSFGIKMCNEIRHFLLRNGGLKVLYKYRILQIKERHKELRWHDNYPGTDSIIKKYENISRITCPICGRALNINYKCNKCDYGEDDY